MRVLGLAFSAHGSSICLVEDGGIAAAINLEPSPRDAVRSMHVMGLDALAIGDYLAWPEDRAP